MSENGKKFYICSVFIFKSSEMEKGFIKVAQGDVTKLAKVFNCTTVMVSYSLNYTKNTKLAKKIRYVAMTQYNGKEYILKNDNKKEKSDEK